MLARSLGLAILAFAAHPWIDRLVAPTAVVQAGGVAKDAQRGRAWLAAHASSTPEVRWKSFVDEVGGDPQLANDVVAAAGRAGDFAFLEDLVLHTRWAQAACSQLASADAPQWPRCAVWCLGRKSDSHTWQGARMLLTQHPVVARGWFQSNPPRSDDERALATELETLAPSAQPDARYLPAFDPAVLFAPLGPAHAPSNPDAVAALAVERALQGYALLYEHAEPWRSFVLQQTRAADARIRSAAYRAITHFQASEVPLSSLWTAVEDPTADVATRELALLAASFGPPAATWARLHGVAADPKHAAWRAAVSRLLDLGDSFTLELLGRLDPDALPESSRALLATTRTQIRDRLSAQASEPALPPSTAAAGLLALLERTAWADLAGHPLAQSLLEHARVQVEAIDARSNARRELDRTLAAYESPAGDLAPVDPAALAERVRQRAANRR